MEEIVLEAYFKPKLIRKASKITLYQAMAHEMHNLAIASHQNSL